MKIINASESIHYQNPAFMRGMQVFTSFISHETDFIFLDAHIERLLKGAHYLFPNEEWTNKHHEIKDFLRINFSPNSYFRLSIFEDICIFHTAIHSPRKENVSMTHAQSERTASLIPGYVKSAAYLNVDLELRAVAPRFNEVVFYDKNKNVCEASTANIFILTEDNQILTPKVSSMVLEGITRTKLMEFFKKNNYHIKESNITQDDLVRAREIWMTNAVSGIRYVDNFNDLKKQNSQYQKIVHEFGRFGERYE